MTQNIFNYVSPDEVTTLYDHIRQCTQKLQALIVEKARAKQAIEVKNAELTEDIDFKWGRNDTERNAQSRENFPDGWKKLDTLEASVKEWEANLAIHKVGVEEIRLLRDLFMTNEYEIPADKRSPA
jgi:hypothetical protein